MRLQLTALLYACVGASAGACTGDGGLTVAQPLPPDAPTSGGSPGQGGSTSSEPDPEGRFDLGGSSQDPGATSASLVPLAATWRVSASAPAEWTQTDFDDSAWSQAVAPVGFGYPDVVSAAEGPSLYARFAFEADLRGGEPLELRLRRDDGAVAYLDGVEVGRWNMDASGSIPDAVTGADGYEYLFARPDSTAASTGRHVLAVEVHSRPDQDLIFAARLRRIDVDNPLDTTLVQLRSRSYGGQYSPANVGAVWIERPEGSFVRSLAVWGAVRREHLLAWNASSAGNRVDAMTSATVGSHRTRLLQWDHKDAAGSEVEPGPFVLRIEFTEANSNEGAPAGPALSLPFDTSQDCAVASTSMPGIEDVVIASPCAY